jgi:hypothetical protein
MHRSGTSALAGLLAGVGLQHPAGSPPPDPFNPRGYWEPLHLLACHNALLDEAGGRWDDPRLAPLAPTPGRLQQLARALQADFPDAGDPTSVVVVKDPRQCRLQPLWNALLAQRGLDAVVVLMHRHPLAVAGSLARGDGLPLSRALLLWLQHQLDAERHSRHLPRLRLPYQQLLHDPAGVLQACRALRPTLPPLPPEALAVACRTIDPSLDHGTGAAEDADPELLRLALAVHGALADPDEARCRAACDQAAAQLAGHLRQIDDQVGQLDTAQLFWRTADDDFHEAASCRRSVTVAPGGLVQQSLPLPAGLTTLQALRLDPSEQPGLLSLLALDCHDGSGHSLWHWAAHHDTPLPARPATPGTRLLDSGSLVLAEDADPGLLLLVP